MNNKIHLLLLAVLLIRQTSAATANLQAKISNDDASDDVYIRLQDLRRTVQAAISEGQQLIANLVSQSVNVKNELLTQKTQNFGRRYKSIENRMRVIKMLANETNSNIDICLKWNEAVISTLPTRCDEALNKCLKPLEEKLNNIETTVDNKIGDIIAEVEALRLQTDLCEGSPSCIESKIAEIELAKTEMPRRILTEVGRADASIQMVNVRVQGCMDRAVAYMIATGAQVLEVIAKCAHQIIG